MCVLLFIKISSMAVPTPRSSNLSCGARLFFPTGTSKTQSMFCESASTDEQIDQLSITKFDFKPALAPTTVSATVTAYAPADPLISVICTSCPAPTPEVSSSSRSSPASKRVLASERSALVEKAFVLVHVAIRESFVGVEIGIPT